MPIYAYKCTACGYARDVLQRMSDPVLTLCPECGADSFVKQVTAAGFQLKGSGWYATDFKGGNVPAAGKDSAGETAGEKAPATAPAASAPDAGKSAAAAPAAAGATAPAAASAPAPTKAD